MGGDFIYLCKVFCVSCAVLVERERRLEDLYKNNKK